MGRRVLVTRPEPAGEATARRLAEQGFEPVLLPLTQTCPLPAAMDERLEKDAGAASAVAITSANGVRHASPELVAALAHLPCHAVGRKTAQAAREAGFDVVHEGPGDAERLAGAMALDFAGRGIVYLCGRVRFPGFEQTLAASGISVLPVETYDTVAVDYKSDAVAVRLGGRPVDAVLLYSAKAAEIIREIVERPELAHLFGDARFLCLSQRVASVFASVERKRVCISPEPNERALLDLLPN